MAGFPLIIDPWQIGNDNKIERLIHLTLTDDIWVDLSRHIA